MVQMFLVYEQVQNFKTFILFNLCKSFLATQYNQADTKTHSYTSIGTYTLTIMAQGPVNTITETFSINVQYPVSTFTVNFPSITGSPSQITYSGSKFVYIKIH